MTFEDFPPNAKSVKDDNMEIPSEKDAVEESGAEQERMKKRAEQERIKETAEQEMIKERAEQEWIKESAEQERIKGRA